MDNQRIDDVITRHRAKRLEEFHTPAIELFESRPQNRLPLLVCEFFHLGERLFKSVFAICCGRTPFRVQYFAPLNSATIDACERRHWRFLDIACGDEGEGLLVSLDRQPRIYVDWDGTEALEETGIEFADFLAEVQRVVSHGRVAEQKVAPDCGGIT